MKGVHTNWWVPMPPWWGAGEEEGKQYEDSGPVELSRVATAGKMGLGGVDMEG